jgi:hypothetical protein
VQKLASLVIANRSVQLLLRAKFTTKVNFLKCVEFAALSEGRALSMLEQQSRNHFEDFNQEVEEGRVWHPKTETKITLSDVLWFCSGMR